MAELIFLGTGPAGGIGGRGKNRRMESSAILKMKSKKILIDVTSDFAKQTKWIADIPDAVFISHGHSDAISGLAQFRRWLFLKKYKGIVPIYAHKQTIKRIRGRFKMLEHFRFFELESFRAIQLFKNITVLPLPVSHALREKIFPTFGYKFFLPNKKVLMYISDSSGWDKGVQREIVSSDILVLDGAMWGKPFFAHLDMKKVAPMAKKWDIGRLIFTQIGRSAPRHEELVKELKGLWNKSEPAYDGMKIEI